MSIESTIAADLGKVGHAFVVGAAKLKAAIIWAGGEQAKIAPEVASIEAVANAVADAVYPGASAVATVVEGVMSRVFTAADLASEAAVANGLNVQLDAATVASIKAVLPTVKAQAQTTPGS